MKVTFLIFLVGILFISACTSQPSAEETAQKLTILLNSHEYKSIYQMMVPDYKAQVPEENFITAMEDTQSGLTYIYEKIIVVEDSANAIIKFGLSITDKDLPIKLQKTEEGWKVDAFGGIISASCRVNAGICVNGLKECSGIGEGRKITDNLECSDSKKCCASPDCFQDADCKRHTHCNLETVRCEPTYTYIEITPWEIFLKYCEKVDGFPKSFPYYDKIGEQGCRKAYDLIYNNGNPTIKMPTEISSSCRADLNFFPKGSAYFRDWGICKTGYLVYVLPDMKEKVDVRALSLDNIDKIARIN